MKYVLIAINKQEASLIYCGNTLKNVLSQFDTDYTRRGFTIEIFEDGELVKIIKRTTT